MHRLILGWQVLILHLLTFLLITLLAVKIKRSLNQYKKRLTKEQLSLEKEYNELLFKEGAIYDEQLRFNEKLSEISSLYEITKDMSVGLRFADIFKILAEYVQKAFLFKRVKLMIIKEKEDSGVNKIYEALGLEDNTLRVKGIIPKLEISTPKADDHDKKVYGLLKNDIRSIQIIKSQWKENPYTRFLPEHAKSYVATPIVINSQLIGILAIEDLPTSDFDKFSILATQFALEMRRIILYERVEEMAITDGLTKAFSKRHIRERLGEEFERSTRHNYNLSFLMIDIDHFKSYNDSYGHLVGDAVLRDIVSLLKANTREVDLVGRFGGEEFCVVLPETGKDEAHLVAERIREIVERYDFRAYDEKTNVTISIGIATFPHHAKDVDELVERSDKALYTAKNSGRNRVCVYEN